MTRMRCRQCRGTGGVWKRLEGIGPEGKPIDDGELHYCVCRGCKGAGFVDQHGRPWHQRRKI